jgi:hypothetical protein
MEFHQVLREECLSRWPEHSFSLDVFYDVQIIEIECWPPEAGKIGLA